MEIGGEFPTLVGFAVIAKSYKIVFKAGIHPGKHIIKNKGSLSEKNDFNWLRLIIGDFLILWHDLTRGPLRRQTPAHPGRKLAASGNC
ncbi:hypothetical protein [Ruficoccus sp. ZRK36]|uniref:hypothetical protein n=1 Tax=Ruficoccus sp. ZRK36 TaxID=2866311 RepID=UPI001C73AF98|nr:hypothetical protein [Ruficoccus sp. ZRK36]QYY35249.1 hypothetical protein K0V07_13215 [Ruficoccus sp. ZRK36]